MARVAVQPILDAEDGFFTPGTMHFVNVNDVTLFAVCDKQAADRIARLLNQVRASTYHNGMNTLIHDLFLSEEGAKHVMFYLHESTTNTIKVQHDGKHLN